MNLLASAGLFYWRKPVKQLLTALLLSTSLLIVPAMAGGYGHDSGYSEGHDNEANGGDEGNDGEANDGANDGEEGNDGEANDGDEGNSDVANDGDEGNGNEGSFEAQSRDGAEGVGNGRECPADCSSAKTPDNDPILKLFRFLKGVFG